MGSHTDWLKIYFWSGVIKHLIEQSCNGRGLFRQIRSDFMKNSICRLKFLNRNFEKICFSHFIADPSKGLLTSHKSCIIFSVQDCLLLASRKLNDACSLRHIIVLRYISYNRIISTNESCPSYLMTLSSWVEFSDVENMCVFVWCLYFIGNLIQLCFCLWGLIQL